MTSAADFVKRVPTVRCERSVNTFKLYFGVLAITAFFALMVVVFVVYGAITYRNDTRDKVGAPVTGGMPLDLEWSLIPVCISIGIFVWASIMFFHIVRGP
jgi:heme/copper-type cytochrome/quinol oxidase subunit 2